MTPDERKAIDQRFMRFVRERFGSEITPSEIAEIVLLDPLQLIANYKATPDRTEAKDRLFAAWIESIVLKKETWGS